MILPLEIHGEIVPELDDFDRRFSSMWKWLAIQAVQTDIGFVMDVSVPDFVVELLSGSEVSAERAVIVNLAGCLYSQGKLSVGAAAEVAGMKRWEFEQWLRDAGIDMPWNEEDLAQELAFVAKA